MKIAFVIIQVLAVVGSLAVVDAAASSVRGVAAAANEDQQPQQGSSSLVGTVETDEDNDAGALASASVEQSGIELEDLEAELEEGESDEEDEEQSRRRATYWEEPRTTKPKGDGRSCRYDSECRSRLCDPDPRSRTGFSCSPKRPFCKVEADVCRSSSECCSGLRCESFFPSPSGRRCLKY